MRVRYDVAGGPNGELELRRVVPGDQARLEDNRVVRVLEVHPESLVACDVNDSEKAFALAPDELTLLMHPYDERIGGIPMNLEAFVQLVAGLPSTHRYAHVELLRRRANRASIEAVLALEPVMFAMIAADVQQPSSIRNLPPEGGLSEDDHTLLAKAYQLGVEWAFTAFAEELQKQLGRAPSPGARSDVIAGLDLLIDDLQNVSQPRDQSELTDEGESYGWAPELTVDDSTANAHTLREAQEARDLLAIASDAEWSGFESQLLRDSPAPQPSVPAWQGVYPKYVDPNAPADFETPSPAPEPQTPGDQEELDQPSPEETPSAPAAEPDEEDAQPAIRVDARAIRQDAGMSGPQWVYAQPGLPVRNTSTKEQGKIVNIIDENQILVERDDGKTLAWSPLDVWGQPSSAEAKLQPVPYGESKIWQARLRKLQNQRAKGKAAAVETWSDIEPIEVWAQVRGPNLFWEDAEEKTGDDKPAPTGANIRFVAATPEQFEAGIQQVDQSALDQDRDYKTAAGLFISTDGKAGYAISHDGEMKWVWSTARGYGKAAVSDAISNGAHHLSAFDNGKLVGFYTGTGFQEYKRDKNWTPGEPDVVYMRLPSSNIGVDYAQQEATQPVSSGSVRGAGAHRGRTRAVA